MKAEIERLLDGLAELREDRRSIGPHHPKFLEWLAAARHCLAQAEDRTALDRFEVLRVARAGNAMWRREELPPAELKGVLTDLAEVEEILRTLGAAESANAIKKDRRTASAPRQQAGVDGMYGTSGSATKEPTVNKGTDTSGGARPPQPTHAKAMESLLTDLGEELKRPEGDVTKIQKMMGDLLDLKKTGDLVERALAAATDPAARWDSVRAPLAQLWAVNREIVVDLLPALLKKS